MNNNQLDDVSDIDVGESIEDRVCRLAIKARPKLSAIAYSLKRDDYHFGLVAEIVALAIAEEREACAQKAGLWALTHDMSSNLRAEMVSAIRANK